ncbi:hypothetical protein FKM82_010623 [Ascaphus truei]
MLKSLSEMFRVEHIERHSFFHPSYELISECYSPCTASPVMSSTRKHSRALEWEYLRAGACKCEAPR